MLIIFAITNSQKFSNLYCSPILIIHKKLFANSLD